MSGKEFEIYGPKLKTVQYADTKMVGPSLIRPAIFGSAYSSTLIS